MRRNAKSAKWKRYGEIDYKLPTWLKSRGAASAELAKRTGEVMKTTAEIEKIAASVVDAMLKVRTALGPAPQDFAVFLFFAPSR